MALKIKTPKALVEELDEDEVAHVALYSKYYEPGVLTYEKHRRLVMNIGMYAEAAGIPEFYIYNSAKQILNEDALDYLTGWGLNSERAVGGAWFSGINNCTDSMYAMVGVMLRNFKDAKYITIQDLIAGVKSGKPPESRLVCIPNFALDKAQGGDVASWELAHVVGWMLSAHGAGQQVVAYCQTPELVNSIYGGVLDRHFDNHFIRLS